MISRENDNPKWIYKDELVYLFPTVHFTLSQIRRISIIMQIFGGCLTLLLGYFFSLKSSSLILVSMFIAFAIYYMGVQFDTIRKKVIIGEFPKKMKKRPKMKNETYERDNAWTLKDDRVVLKNMKYQFSIIQLYALALILKIIGIFIIVLSILSLMLGQYIMMVLGLLTGLVVLVYGFKLGSISKNAKAMSLTFMLG